MSGGKVLYLRHGRTLWNKTHRLQGQSDIALDEVGREQAAVAAGALAKVNPARIVSSDLVRAADTAAALAEATGLSFSTDPRLRERSFGDWEGLTRDEIEARWPAEFADWTSGDEPPGLNIESRAQVGERMGAAFAEYGADLRADDVVVLVSHGAAIRVAISAALGQHVEDWFGVGGLGNCHWSVLEPLDSRAPGWHLTHHNVSAV